MNRFRAKFWKRTCGNAFSTWRSGAFKMAVEEIQGTTDVVNEKLEKHSEVVRKRKDANIVKALKVMGNQNMRNMFAGWRNTARLLKLERRKRQEFSMYCNEYTTKSAVLKWKLRVAATRKARQRVRQLRYKYHRIRLRQYFFALRTEFAHCKSFVSRIANLANIND